MCRKSICLASLIMVLGLVGYVFANDADTEIPDTRGNKPVLDGVVDDIWSLSAENIMTMSREGTAPDSAADCSGSWWALWDWDYLYILVDVNDEELVQDSGEAEGWNDDRVEIFIDGDNSKDAVFWGGGVNDYQYCFRWNNGEVETPVEMYFSDSGIDKLEGVEYAVATTEHGYLVEIALPWSTLIDEPPLPGQLIGIEVMIDDDDDGGGRDTQFSWYIEEAGAPHYPSLWGTAMLTAIPAPEPVNPGAEGLVAHYEMENNANDSSGNGLHGTIVGDPAFVEGKVGMALDFDGTDDLVELGKFDVVGQITLAAWIKADDFEINDARVISKANEWGGNDHWWMLSTISETSLRFRLKTDDGQDTTTLISDPVLEAGVWTHVAVTWDGSMMRIYKDGQEVASQEKGGSAVAVDPAVSVAIGSQPSDAFASDPSRVVKFFDGLIDDARIYDRALSEGELLYLAGERATPVDPGTDGLVAFYALDGDPNDSSGNDNNGTIGGTENWVDGKIGSALEFDGSSTYVEIPFSESLRLLNQGDFTLSAWFKPDEIPPENKEVFQQGDGNGTGRTWLFVHSSNEIRSYLGGGTTASGIGVEADTWYHAAVAVTEGGDADNIQLYVNGQQTGEPTQRNMEDCEGVYFIGRHKNPTNFWDGLIDEIQLYNRGLSAGEIRYLAGAREVDPSLVIYYSFDEVSDIVADQSGKGHDGVVVGDVTAEANGMYNGAANFPTGSYLDLDGPSFPAEDIPTSAMTLAAWIKCANTGGDHEIFSARASDNTWLIHPEPKSSGDIRWLLRSYGGTTIFQIRAGTMTWDEWLHFAGTYDKESGKAALYINGELIEEIVVENPADIAGDWGLGARVGLTIDDARPFTGLMDEFRMYTRALSQDEILEIMQGM